MIDAHHTGTVCKWLSCGVFITPDGADFDDRSATIFAHERALERGGIAAENLRLGDRLQFRTKPSRRAGGRPEAYDLALVA